jgi:hypothetical protein
MSYETPVVFFDTAKPALLALPLPSREAIQAFQREIAKYAEEMPEAEHFFAKGQYGREFRVKAGKFLTGKIHRHEHLVMLASGEVTINTDKGMERITGPKMWVSPAGAKRVLYTHTDCVFWTAHLNLTNTRDLAEIEAEHIEPEPSPFEGLPELSNDIQRLYA